MPVFSSTIIPTVGRSTLERAVESVLGQAVEADALEVIVVNDSGRLLPEAAWQRDPRVHVLNTHRRERSVARNTGAAAARGSYLHFLDDDDWLADGALQVFRDLARTTDAGWLYGAAQLVDRQDKPLIVLEPELHGNCFLQAMAGEWVPLQASFIRADVFFEVSGFNPLLCGPEDIDLLRRAMLHTDIAGTVQIVACVARGEEGSTTDYEHSIEQSRGARERILSSPGVFARMRGSASSSGWHGRVGRIFFTSAVWNLQRKRFFPAASRLTLGAAGCALAGRHVLSASFWRSLARPYASETFARGFERARADGR